MNDLSLCMHRLTSIFLCKVNPDGQSPVPISKGVIPLEPIVRAVTEVSLPCGQIHLHNFYRVHVRWTDTLTYFPLHRKLLEQLWVSPRLHRGRA